MAACLYTNVAYRWSTDRPVLLASRSTRLAGSFARPLIASAACLTALSRLTRSNKSSPKQAQLSFGNVTGPGNRLKRRMWFVRNARQRSAVAKEAYSASMLDAEVSQRSARWSAQRTGGVMYNNNPFQINCFYYAFIFRPAHPNTAQHPSWIGCTIYALQGSNLPANAALRRSGPARLYCYAGFSHAIMCNACMNRFYAVVR